MKLAMSSLTSVPSITMRFLSSCEYTSNCPEGPGLSAIWGCVGLRVGMF